MSEISICVCPPEWLTPRGAVEVFGINRTRLSQLQRDGEIRWKKLPTRAGDGGGKARVLLNAGSIREWIERQEGN